MSILKFQRTLKSHIFGKIAENRENRNFQTDSLRDILDHKIISR